jgi:hypothetical protein
VSYRDNDAALLADCAISDGEARDAAQVLAGWARDATELRDWLEMAGLLPAGGVP